MADVSVGAVSNLRWEGLVAQNPDGVLRAQGNGLGSLRATSRGVSPMQDVRSKQKRPQRRARAGRSGRRSRAP